MFVELEEQGQGAERLNSLAIFLAGAWILDFAFDFTLR
jgi:hypothetical protein